MIVFINSGTACYSFSQAEFKNGKVGRTSTTRVLHIFYLRQRDRLFSSALVGSFAGLRKNYSSNFQQILGEVAHGGWAKEETIRCCGNPDHIASRLGWGYRLWLRLGGPESYPTILGVFYPMFVLTILWDQRPRAEDALY